MVPFLLSWECSIMATEACLLESSWVPFKMFLILSLLGWFPNNPVQSFCYIPAPSFVYLDHGIYYTVITSVVSSIHEISVSKVWLSLSLRLEVSGYLIKCRYAHAVIVSQIQNVTNDKELYGSEWVLPAAPARDFRAPNFAMHYSSVLWLQEEPRGPRLGTRAVRMGRRSFQSDRGILYLPKNKETLSSAVLVFHLNCHSCLISHTF